MMVGLYDGGELSLRLQQIRDNDPYTCFLDGEGGGYHDDFIRNITNEQWEEIGRIISNNTHLSELRFYDGALNGETASHLFRGLTRSTSIEEVWLNNNNDLGTAGVRSMVPFLQASNLQILDFYDNNIQSEGFNILCRALRDSPIDLLDCARCGIESIEIENEHFPRHLTYISETRWQQPQRRWVSRNIKIAAGGDSTLTHLHLDNNQIDDEGVAIIVDALQGNTSLKTLHLAGNEGISDRGEVMLLRLVNDISNINSTLQSNHTLTTLELVDLARNKEASTEREFINTAIHINRKYNGNPDAAGRQKVIKTQLHSVTRAVLAQLQGVSQPLYGEINPLYLPEVLSLVGRRYGQRELYVALQSSIAGVISTVNRKKQIKKQLVCCKEKSKALNAELVEIKRQLAYYEANTKRQLSYDEAMSKELNSELAEMEAAEGVEVEDESCEAPRSKRRCY